MTRCITSSTYASLFKRPCDILTRAHHWVRMMMSELCAYSIFVEADLSMLNLGSGSRVGEGSVTCVTVR